MSNVADADLIFVCSEIMEIDAWLAVLNSAWDDGPVDEDVKAEMTILAGGRNELLARLGDMPACTTAGLRAKVEVLQAVLKDCTRLEAALAGSALRDVLAVIGGG